MIELIKAGIKTEEYISNAYPGAKEILDKIREEIESIPFVNRGSYRRIDIYMKELKEKMGGDIFPSDILPLISYAFPTSEIESMDEEEDEDNLSLAVEADKILTLYLVLKYHPFRGMILRRLISRGINSSFFLKTTPGEMVKLMEFFSLADHEAVEKIRRYLSTNNSFLLGFGADYDEPKIRSVLSYPYLVEFELERDTEEIISRLKRKALLNEVRERIARDILLRLSAFSGDGRTIALIGPRGTGKSTLINLLLKSSGWPFFSISLSPPHIDNLLGSEKEEGLLFKGVVSCGVINPCMIFEDIETPGKRAQRFLLQITDPYYRQELRDEYTGTRLLLGKAPVFLIGSKLTKRFDHPAIKSNLEIYEVPPFNLEEMMTILVGYILPKVIMKIKPQYRKGLEPLRDRETAETLIDLLKDRQTIKGGYTLDGLERAVEKIILILLSRKEKDITAVGIKKLSPLLKNELGGKSSC